MRHIPKEEIRLVFVRSGGPGGQNVNKTATKVQLHWNFARSAVFNEKEKAGIRSQLARRINKDGELVISVDETRSQVQNRETALERLERLVHVALTPKTPRIATKPSRAAKAKRLTNKKRRSHTKQLRRSVDD